MLSATKKVWLFLWIKTGSEKFPHTDKLSETLQKVSMSEAGGQRSAKRTKDVLISISNDACYVTFYQTVLRKRKFKLPSQNLKYQEIKQFLRVLRLELGHLHSLWLLRKYIEESSWGTRFNVSAIQKRFEQPSFEAHVNVEIILISFWTTETYHHKS